MKISLSSGLQGPGPNAPADILLTIGVGQTYAMAPVRSLRTSTPGNAIAVCDDQAGIRAAGNISVSVVASPYPNPVGTPFVTNPDWFLIVPLAGSTRKVPTCIGVGLGGPAQFSAASVEWIGVSVSAPAVTAMTFRVKIA